MGKPTLTLKKIARSVLPWGCRRIINRYRAFHYIARLPKPADPSKKTIVAFNHFFDQDIRALRRANAEYNFVAVETPILFRGARIFFDADVRELRAPYGNTPSRRLAQYRRECELIYKRLEARLDPALFVSASDVFYWLREFIVVASDHGVKHVVIDKEGTISPYDFDREAQRIRKNAPFMSDHIFVWSERQREFWGKIGVADRNITVVGQPRSDLLHHEQNREVDGYFPRPQRLITFFSYMDNAYIPIAAAHAEGLTWKVMREDTHAEVHRLAVEHPDYNFVVKTHPQQPDLDDLRRKHDRENLKVVGGSAVSNELLQRSELIIAFQTTAVIEAMLLGKRVIYSYWDPLIARFECDLLPFHEASGLVITRSLEQFREVCKRFFAGDRSDFELNEDEARWRDEFVNRYFYRPDGRVCERFYEAVRPFVK